MTTFDNEFKLPPKQPNGIRIALPSDVHLAVRSLKIEDNMLALDRTVFSTRTLASLDAVIIPGDLFDRLINLPSDYSHAVTKWFISILRRCKQFDVALRILEGTPSHDWKQSKLLCTLNEYAEVGCDIKYFDELTIDVDKKLGLTIGYVPDEIRESYKDTERAFGELMKTRGYAQIDLIIAHGFFEFQLPEKVMKMIQISTFRSSMWSKWAKYYIVIGHDHIHKHRGNIIVPGSFNRTKHGEEDPKGYIVIDICNNTAQWMFVENVYAQRFDGLILSEYDDAKAKRIFDDRLTELSTFPAASLSVVISSESELKAYIDDVGRSSKVKIKLQVKSKLAKEATLVEAKMRTPVINITSDNVSRMIVDEIGLDIIGSDLDQFMVEIERIKNM